MHDGEHRRFGFIGDDLSPQCAAALRHSHNRGLVLQIVALAANLEYTQTAPPT